MVPASRSRWISSGVSAANSLNTSSVFCPSVGGGYRYVGGVAERRSGLASRAIASRLVVSERTVNNHLQTIYGKLGINSRGQLAKILRQS